MRLCHLTMEGSQRTAKLRVSKKNVKHLCKQASKETMPLLILTLVPCLYSIDKTVCQFSEVNDWSSSEPGVADTSTAQYFCLQAVLTRLAWWF